MVNVSLMHWSHPSLLHTLLCLSLLCSVLQIHLFWNLLATSWGRAARGRGGGGVTVGWHCRLGMSVSLCREHQDADLLWPSGSGVPAAAALLH